MERGNRWSRWWRDIISLGSGERGRWFSEVLEKKGRGGLLFGGINGLEISLLKVDFISFLLYVQKNQSR